MLKNSFIRHTKQKFIFQIARESKVCIANDSYYMIHFDGEQFL